MMMPYICEGEETNMKIKGVITVGIAGCLLLGGCSFSTTSKQSDGGSEKQEEGTSYTQNGSNSWSDSERAAYYENMLQELNDELLDLKTQLYSVRVEYESELERLRSEAETQPSSQQLPFAYTVSNGLVTVISYLGQDSEVIVPQTIEGLPVVEIADRAFQNNVGLRAVKLPEGIRKIGWFAFSGCALLETVVLPTSLETVCYGAFENCSSSMGVHCKQGSYAEQYAQSYGMRVSYS